MRVFVSSLISGMEPIREAVVAAVKTLGHEPVTAEAFGARPDSPQVTCLAGVRESDCIVLVLGSRYGSKQPSGLSATHEEFREARDRRPLLVFLDATANPEPDQQKLVAEVQQWQGGQFTESFSTPEQLRNGVTRALHRWELSTATGGPDTGEMLARAMALLTSDNRGYRSGPVTLSVAVVGGPRQAVLRPVEMEEGPLRRYLRQAARYGSHAIFVEEEGVETQLEGHALVLSQASRSIHVDEEGAVRIVLPLLEGREGVTAIIEEDVRATLLTGLRFASALLDEIDGVHRLSHVAVAARVDGSGRSWRTRQEHAASPDRGSWGMHGGDQQAVTLSPPSRPRGALRQQSEALAEDITVLLRRQFKSVR